MGRDRDPLDTSTDTERDPAREPDPGDDEPGPIPATRRAVVRPPPPDVGDAEPPPSFRTEPMAAPPAPLVPPTRPGITHEGRPPADAEWPPEIPAAPAFEASPRAPASRSPDTDDRTRRLVRAGGALAFGMLLGCVGLTGLAWILGPRPAPDRADDLPSIEEQQARLSSLEATNPFHSGERWRGTITCGGTARELTIDIRHVRGAQVEVALGFDDESWLADGAYDRALRGLRLAPRGGAPHVLRGTVDVTGDRFAGMSTVDDGCVAFESRRVGGLPGGHVER
ncbi:MAG: hypothetical protein AB7S26_20665 [Sandaracinaceae bacterium]